MAPERFPGAVWTPGDFAGYTRGRTAMTAVKLHYTVGVDSTPIGLRGYFQFLMPKVGPPLQFAEVDALCWDSGQGNQYGPGIEFERLSDQEPLTADQLHWGSQLIHWLNAEWGIPLTFVDTPHAATFPLSGFVTHRSLPPPNDHVDYISQDDWDTMTATAPPVHQEDEMKVLKNVDTGQQYLIDGGMFAIDDETASAYRNVLGVDYHEGNQRECDVISSAYPTHVGNSGSGLSTSDVKTIINATKLSV